MMDTVVSKRIILLQIQIMEYGGRRRTRRRHRGGDMEGGRRRRRRASTKRGGFGPRAPPQPNKAIQLYNEDRALKAKMGEAAFREMRAKEFPYNPAKAHKSEGRPGVR